MTREDAINLLTQVNHILVNSNSWLENTHEPLNIAFDMAIKALEQEPTTKNDLGVDCISRAEVNQVIEDYMDEQYNVLSDRTRERAFGAKVVMARINELPSVTPQEPILDKIRAEIEDSLYVDSLIFGELIDFKNGKISADDVIEEFNRVTRTEVLKIIDKYKAESEVADGNDD